VQVLTDGLVLKEQAAGESDRLITVLTRSSGVIRAFARGARNLKNKSAAATQTLSYSDFTFFCGRESNTIDSADVKKVFFGLRNDLNRLTLGQYFSELALALAPQEENAEDYLRLLLNGLHFLENGSRPPRIVKAAVEMRIMALSGYMPDLVGCTGCGCYESEPMYFSLKAGVITCGKCHRENEGPTAVLTSGVLAALRHTIYAPFPKLFSFELSEEGQRMLESASERYVLTQLERNFKTLDFYRRVAQM
jgi:DNA repair protein RecO (recombination protein O)